MNQYPKHILTIEQQVQSYIDAGMIITSRADIEKALKSVGFYRLRGYSFQLYDNATKKYALGTKFEDILKLYQFDQELSALIFSMISKIEVALRVRLVEALLIHKDPLVLQDSSIFNNYWLPRKWEKHISKSNPSDYRYPIISSGYDVLEF